MCNRGRHKIESSSCEAAILLEQQHVVCFTTHDYDTLYAPPAMSRASVDSTTPQSPHERTAGCIIIKQRASIVRPTACGVDSLPSPVSSCVLIYIAQFLAVGVAAMIVFEYNIVPDGEQHTYIRVKRTHMEEHV